MPPALPPGLLAVEGAILRASRPGERGPFAQVCAVFGPDGAPLPLARTRSRIGWLSLPAPCPDPATLPLRGGTWLFGGIGFPHFGHALMFSTARLWALDHWPGPLDGILFFDRAPGGTSRAGTTGHLTAILALLGIDLPIVTIAADARVDRLIVPEQGLSTSPDLFCGTDRQRAFLRRRLGPPPEAPAGGRVYLSRWKLGLARAGLMFEDRIETLLAAAGYRIFHPERASLAEQVALYRSADRILGVDGSALHLAAFAAHPKAHVGIIARRPYFAEALADQVRAASGARATVFRPPARLFRPAGEEEPSDAWTATYCLPDLPALGQDLARAGFLPGPARGWSAPDAADLAARLALIGRRSHGRVPEPLAPDP
jgi:hypothetical protein